jgi:hypothetical protein
MGFRAATPWYDLLSAMIANAATGLSWKSGERRKCPDTDVCNKTTFLAAPENAKTSVALLLLLAASAGATLAAFLSTLEIHDPVISWLICTG